MNSDFPVQIAAGWSRDGRSPLSLSIRYMTRPGWLPRPLARWSHMFLMFRFGDGRTVIHEALMSEGWCSKPGDKLDAWRRKDRRNHIAEVHWMPIPAPTVERIYRASCCWVGTKSYAVSQLLAFAAAESLVGRLLGLALGPDPDAIVCSEGAARLIGCFAPEWDLRSAQGEAWDNVTPQAAYDRCMEKLDEHRDHT